MPVNNNPQPPTRQQLERQLKDAKKALQAARMAILDPNPDVTVLTAERDHAEMRRADFHRRHWELRQLEMQLHDYLGPIESEHDPELLAEIRRVRAEREAMGEAIEEADKAASKALLAVNQARDTHINRRRAVSQLEQLILSIECELTRVDPRPVTRARSWRELIEQKE